MSLSKVWPANEIDDLVSGVNSWLSIVAIAFVKDGLQKLVQRYTKWLYLGGDYIGKSYRYVS